MSTRGIRGAIMSTRGPFQHTRGPFKHIVLLSLFSFELAAARHDYSAGGVLMFTRGPFLPHLLIMSGLDMLA